MKLVRADWEANPPVDLPIVAFYDTDRAVLDVPERIGRAKPATFRRIW